MTWWRRLWHRIVGRDHQTAPEAVPAQPQTTPTPPPATRSTGPRPAPSRGSEPAKAHESRADHQRPPRAGQEVERDDTSLAAEQPVPAGPGAVAPPPPAKPVSVEVARLPDVPVEPPSFPAQHVPQVRPRADIVHDQPFDLPDFSTVTYPVVTDGFIGPSWVVSERPRVDVGRSPYSVRATSELLDELSTAESTIGAALRHEPITIALPAAGSSPGSYALPRLPETFVDADTGQPRTLRRAVESQQAADSPDALDRLELVRLVARLLDGLHAQDHFTAGVDLDAIAYALHPRPAVTLVAGDRVRRVGGDFLSVAPSITSSMDGDREGFALLAQQLLLPDGRFEHDGIVGLDESQVRAARSLWNRAAGPEGTRPQVGAWLAVLG